MQFNLDCSWATVVFWWLKDAVEDIWGACSIFLSSITSVKSHHGMRDQIYRFCAVWRAFKKQLGFLKIKPGRIKSKTTHQRELQVIYSLESLILQVWHTAEIFHFKNTIMFHVIEIENRFVLKVVIFPLNKKTPTSHHNRNLLFKPSLISLS